MGQAKADSFAFAEGQSTPMDNNCILADVMICQTMVSLSLLREGERASEKNKFLLPFLNTSVIQMGAKL